MCVFHKIARSIVVPSFVCVLSIFLLVGNFACTKKNKIGYGLDLNETLRWHVSTEPPTLDWNLMTDNTSSKVADVLMDGLVQYSFKEDQVTLEPALATEWTHSPDMKTWTFTLRPNVRWSDGVPFVAQHVLDSWERVLSAKTGSEYSSYLSNIKNAKAYFSGKKTFKEVGVSINDKGQIVVELETPQSYFPSLLAHQSTYPIRKDVIEKFGNKWTEPEHFVGIGPYRLKTWDHDKALVLERNDDYYGKKHKVKYILGIIVPEASTALNMFRKGDLDSLDDPPQIEVAKIKNMAEFRSRPVLSLNYLGFNVKKPPFDQVKVRKAVNMAIDRDMINKVFNNERIPAHNFVPPGLLGHDLSIGDRFNLEQANKLLDEAGYKDRSKMPKIKISFNTNESIQRIIENIQGQLKKNLGIEVEIANEEWKTYLKTLLAKDFQVFRMSWIADYPDAESFLGIFTTDSGNNRTQWSNKKYDSLLKEAAAEGDDNKRAELYKQAQRILNEDEIPVIPLYFSRNQQLVHKRIKGFPQNSMLKFYVHDLEIVPEK